MSAHLARLKADLENALTAYALATHAEETEDASAAFVTSWVAVAEVMSDEMEGREEWGLVVSRPASQRTPSTIGLLACAIEDVKP